MGFAGAGSPFLVDVVNHPRLEHDGLISLWQTNLASAQISAIKTIAEQNGATVSIYASDGDESKQETLDAAKKLQADGWKTDRCPLCYFCDLTIPSRCGKTGWHPQVLAKAMSIKKAQEAAALCPLLKKP